jgi:hypothetical protein
MNCNDLIKDIYLHPAINKLIANIHPKELQDDLRQELAIELLTQDCERLQKINKEGNLIGYALRIIWKMGTLQNGSFYKLFKKKEDYEKAKFYMEIISAQETNFKGADLADKILNEKLLIDACNAHESMIFKKYVELRSAKKVAEYFGIPMMHTFQVIKKTREELKNKIRKRM